MGFSGNHANRNAWKRLPAPLPRRWRGRRRPAATGGGSGACGGCGDAGGMGGTGGGSSIALLSFQSAVALTDCILAASNAGRGGTGGSGEAGQPGSLVGGNGNASGCQGGGGGSEPAAMGVRAAPEVCRSASATREPRHSRRQQRRTRTEFGSRRHGRRGSGGHAGIGRRPSHDHCWTATARCSWPPRGARDGASRFEFVSGGVDVGLRGMAMGGRMDIGWP
jgi:hypothetical protein